MAFVTDRNRPQPLWQPPPTACLTACGAASESPALLMHRWSRRSRFCSISPGQRSRRQRAASSKRPTAKARSSMQRQAASSKREAGTHGGAGTHHVISKAAGGMRQSAASRRTHPFWTLGYGAAAAHGHCGAPPLAAAPTTTPPREQWGRADGAPLAAETPFSGLSAMA